MVAAETLPPERIKMVLAFADHHQMLIRKFSIKLSDVDYAGDSAGQNGTARIAATPSAAGKIVAGSSTLG